MKRLGMTLVLAGSIVAIAAAPASGAATRVEYASQMNQVCTDAAAEADALLNKPPKGRAKLSRFLDQIVDLNERTTDAIALVAPAPGDESLAASWVAARRESERALDKITDTTRALLRVFKPGTKISRKKIKKLGRAAKRATRDFVRSFKDESTYGTQLGATSCVTPPEVVAQL